MDRLFHWLHPTSALRDCAPHVVAEAESPSQIERTADTNMSLPGTPISHSLCAEWKDVARIIMLSNSFLVTQPHA